MLDTGSEQTTISRQTASSAVVRPITYTLSAGVGEVGLRGLQLGRLDTFEIGTLKLSNVPALIKAPALRGIPKRETESFSPLGLGLSMTIDYATHKLTIGQHAAGGDGRVHAADAPPPPVDGARPDQRHAPDLLRRRHRRRGHLDQHRDGRGARSRHAARKIALRVYGTSGWDRDAFLMPGVNLKFNDIAYNNFSVVVLNLQAPSVLLGFQVGGIVGHKFLSPYRVSLDLERSELRMTKAN